MGVDQLGDVVRRGVPVDDQLTLSDHVAGVGADQMDAERRPAARRDEDLGGAAGHQDLALAVAGQVVGELRELDAAGCGHGAA